MEKKVSANISHRPEAAARASDKQAGAADGASDVLVCIDETDAWKRAIPHARAVASAFGGEVVLVTVIETRENGRSQLDPVDWEIRKRRARTNLQNLAKEYATSECGIKTRTLEGNTIDQLCACASQRPQDITTVAGRGGTASLASQSHLAHVVDIDIGSVLMVPPDAEMPKGGKYRRIFVPLDGSPLAESAIPNAVALARSHEAELLLCHMMPDPGITVIGPSDESAEALQMQIRQRNMRTGKAYLKRIGGRVKDAGVQVKTVFVDSADVRRSLLEAARMHASDLIVMASHGQGGQPDVPTGHVAGFILHHSTIPVLMVRRQQGNGNTHAFSGVHSNGIRVPSKTNNG
jgi:nucleotide-binding universal stress UspA family protein